jgi:hypothetical protein
MGANERVDVISLSTLCDKIKQWHMRDDEGIKLHEYDDRLTEQAIEEVCRELFPGKPAQDILYVSAVAYVSERLRSIGRKQLMKPQRCRVTGAPDGLMDDLFGWAPPWIPSKQGEWIPRSLWSIVEETERMHAVIVEKRQELRTWESMYADNMTIIERARAAGIDPNDIHFEAPVDEDEYI